jgi:hypothetical protein
MFFQILGSIAEFEHALMSERTIDGLAAARARGRTGGQKPKLGTRQVTLAREMYEETGEDGRRRYTVARSRQSSASPAPPSTATCPRPVSDPPPRADSEQDSRTVDIAVTLLERLLAVASASDDGELDAPDVGVVPVARPIAQAERRSDGHEAVALDPGLKPDVQLAQMMIRPGVEVCRETGQDRYRRAHRRLEPDEAVELNRS